LGLVVEIINQAVEIIDQAVEIIDQAVEFIAQNTDNRRRNHIIPATSG
jgi:hypothetical protein